MSKPIRAGSAVTMAAYALLATPPARTWLESSMARHMLVQIPLLVIIGALLVPWFPVRIRNQLSAFNAHGIPLTLLALFAAAYWMLPRSLDGALNFAIMEFAKFVTLPLLVGLPLALSWRELSLVGQGFVWSNFVSMLGVLGWLYLVAPVRICNNYLVDQQLVLGQGLLAVTLALFAVGAMRVLVGNAARQIHPDASSAARMNSYESLVQSENGKLNPRITM